MRHIKLFENFKKSDLSLPDNATILDEWTKKYGKYSLSDISEDIVNRLQQTKDADEIEEGYVWSILSDMVMRDVSDGFYHPDESDKSIADFIDYLLNGSDSPVYVIRQSDFSYDPEPGLYVMIGKTPEDCVDKLLKNIDEYDYDSLVSDYIK